MSEKKPMLKCPYCGEKMTLHLGYPCNAQFFCERCKARAPRVKGYNAPEAAYECALRRYEEQNRMLLIEEMVFAKHCFVEWKGTFGVEECMSAIIARDISPETGKVEKKLKLYMADGVVYTCDLGSYGITIRCWKENPTSDDYDNVKWLSAKKLEGDDE